MIKLSKEKIKPLLDAHFHKQLHRENYIIENLNPLNLLNKARFDLNAKLLYLDGFSKNNYNYEDLYFSFVNAFTLGTFLEPGNAEKNSIKIFRKSFKEIFNSIKFEEFDLNKSLVPISKEGIILNGSHRVAAAIKLKKQIYCIRLNIKAPNYDYKFFKNRLVSEDFLDQCALKQVKINKDLHVAIIWPAASSKVKIEDFLPNIFYKKSLKLTLNGLRNFVSIVYQGEEWLGSIKNGFPGAINKALPCYADKPITIIVFKPIQKNNLVKIKTKIRDLLSIGKNSIHINDSYNEGIRICESFFNNNTIDFLNKTRDTKRKSFYFNFNKFKEFTAEQKIDKKLVALDGSMILSAYSLRDARDIDYIAHSSILKKIKNKESSLISYHNKEVERFYKISLDDLITDSRNYFIFQDFKFISLKKLAIMKYYRNEKKDKLDLLIINSTIEKSFYNQLYVRLKQFLFFSLLKIKKNIIFVLRKIKIYSIVKKLFYLISNI